MAATPILGCGSSPTEKEAARGRVRVEVARIAMLVAQDDNSSDLRRDTFRDAENRALDIGAYGLAAEAASARGAWHRSRDEDTQAIEAFVAALRYDKQQHLAVRSSENPFAHSAAIAVTLANLSVTHEDRGAAGDQNAAILYAERAYKINRALGLASRIQYDIARLLRLYEQTGQTRRYNELIAERDILLPSASDASSDASAGENAGTANDSGSPESGSMPADTGEAESDDGTSDDAESASDASDDPDGE